jgi:hypothetical protein
MKTMMAVRFELSEYFSADCRVVTKLECVSLRRAHFRPLSCHVWYVDRKGYLLPVHVVFIGYSLKIPFSSYWHTQRLKIRIGGRNLKI